MKHKPQLSDSRGRCCLEFHNNNNNNNNNNNKYIRAFQNLITSIYKFSQTSASVAIYSIETWIQIVFPFFSKLTGCLGFNQ